MMQNTRWTKRVAALLLTGATLALVVPAVSAPASAQSADPLGPGGEIFFVDPDRLLDTRDPGNDVAPGGAKPSDPDGETFRLKATGRFGVPEQNVLAVLVNVTAVAPAQPGYLSVRPGGQPEPDPPTTLVNFVPGATAGNLGIVGVNASGEIDIELVSAFGPDRVHVVVDVYGWIATSSHVDGADVGARVVSVFPERVLDTRVTEQILPATIDAGPLQPYERVAMQMRGAGPIPNDPDVVGVVVNMAGVSAAGTTYISFTPTAPPPGVASNSNGNFEAGPPRANLSIAPLGADGMLHIANGPSSVDVVLDVVGYLVKGESDTTQAGRVVPLEQPFRSFDTRQIEFGSVRLGDSQWEDWSFTSFSQSVAIGGQTDISQQGFFGNLVAFDLQSSGLTFFTLNPRQPQRFTSAPSNSTLNLPAGREVGNMSLVRYGTDGQGDDAMISAYNDDGSTHYVLDVYAVILDD